MCLTLLITTGCDTNREEDVNDGGINDNIICFSELFKDDVIVYTGYYHKGDNPIGKDSEISLMKIFTTDGKEGMVTTYWLGSDRYRGRALGKFAKMQDDEILKSLVNTDGLRMYQEKEGEVAFYSKSEKWYHFNLITDETGNYVSRDGFVYEYVGYPSAEDDVYFTGHIEVYQSSYMLFQNEDKFLLIRDTEKTKDKEVVFDELGTEGIYIDGEPSTMQDYDSESMPSSVGELSPTSQADMISIRRTGDCYEL